VAQVPVPRSDLLGLLMKFYGKLITIMMHTSTTCSRLESPGLPSLATFGLCAHDLAIRLRHRLETCSDPVTVTACERFLAKPRVDPADNKEDLLDQAW
jgi:hypothetical protein